MKAFEDWWDNSKEVDEYYGKGGPEDYNPEEMSQRSWEAALKWVDSHLSAFDEISITINEELGD